ncbi:hypothetical protein SCUP515_11426 [Seiridium cupressi]
MAQIGSIRSSLAQVTQELTVAAANLNFDFTLIKLEAPAEYKGVGNALTASRVREAETGPLHMTARRLGALFEGVCPDTPNLIKAYGMRASEISKEVSEGSPHDSPTWKSNWVRTEYGGIDATSLWAAATSSKAALPVHLLACIIARVWTSSEAISLWVEIVEERKREVLSRFEESGHIQVQLISAIQQEISREHLAKWDASARAWLQTADKARERQYKQFLLIVNNLSIAINRGDTSLYSNVVHVWTAALSAMEGLICGSPYTVKDGPVLLGLSAWHIFPDMIIFNTPLGTKEVVMNDILVKQGGVLSLGISDVGRQEQQGIYWSLSLAHHKFYGGAVKRTRRLDVDGTRLSLNELVLVCMGSLMRLWGIPKKDTANALKALQAIALALSTVENVASMSSWHDILEEPLASYLAEDSQARLATSLGRRRQNFLPGAIATAHKPLFGLLHLPTLLILLKDADARIHLLRRLVARTVGLNNENSIIVLFDDTFPRKNLTFATTSRIYGDQNASHSNTGRYHRWVQKPQANLSSQNENEQLFPSSNQAVDFDMWTDLDFDSDGGEQDQEGGSEDRQGNAKPQQGGEDQPSEHTKNMNMEVPTGNKQDSACRVEGSKGTGTNAHSAKENITANLNDEDDVADGETGEETGDMSIERSFSSIGSQNGQQESHDKHKDHLDDAAVFTDLGFPLDYESISGSFLDPTEPKSSRFTTESTKDDLLEEGTDDRLDATMEHYEKRCARYLNAYQRTLGREVVQFLEGKPSTYPKTAPWNYDGVTNTVTHPDSTDEYVFSLGLKSGSEFGEHASMLEHAAIYVKDRVVVDWSKDFSLTLEDILWCLSFNMVDLGRLDTAIGQQAVFPFLEVLAAVSKMYSEPAAGGATISCSIVERPFDPPIFSKRLEAADWFHAHSYVTISQSSTISLIGYFETGHNVLEGMKGTYNIIGLSGGDSIFVLTSLLQDPETKYPDHSFSRILGNTGTAGFSILTTPSELMLRQRDPAAWLVEPVDFDGAPQDSFKNTSLHLAFTDWRAPLVRFQSVGERDADVNIIEAVISVRDFGKWVADVDIYRALVHRRLLEDSDILSVESWDQVLDCTDGSVAVRCHSNWVAKLAVLSVLAQHMTEERPIVICPRSCCWGDFVHYYECAQYRILCFDP